jgi:hypothetical protein
MSAAASKKKTPRSQADQDEELGIALSWGVELARLSRDWPASLAERSLRERVDSALAAMERA